MHIGQAVWHFLYIVATKSYRVTMKSFISHFMGDILKIPSRLPSL